MFINGSFMLNIELVVKCVWCKKPVLPNALAKMPNKQISDEKILNFY